QLMSRSKVFPFLCSYL
uniref:Predicted gene, 17482 n=1 Tax=Mus spicilegus TaxID=10103 RepID=A0A8C6ILE3_MUSSI